MGKKAIVFLADGFEETEALAPIDIMRRTGVDVRLISINETRTVTSSHGIVITADQTLAEGIGEYDLLMLPGGMPGTTNLDSCQDVKLEVMKAYDAKKRLAAICAGPMVYGKLGLLRGLKATCFPGFEQYLDGATVVSDLVVTDGQITTAKGAGASLLLGVELVRLLMGEETSEKVASQIQMK